MSEAFDFLVAGGGIVGASVAFHLAPHGSVCILEQESAPGYHSTGRSAALYSENYGTSVIQQLTVMARDFFESPPAGFAMHPLLTPRGMIYIGTREEGDAIERALIAGQSAAPDIHRITRSQVLELCPVLRPEFASFAIYEPGARDMDVDAILQGYLRGVRRAGGAIATNAAITRVERVGAFWQVVAGGRHYEAPVLVNAAGAWCDELAALAGATPIGLVPKRRTAITVDPPHGTDIHRWPMVYRIDDSLYIKPESGRLLACPVDVTPSAPCDAQPDEYDVAVAAERLEEATTLKVDRIHRKWAGLRSFVEDGDPVIGEDPQAKGFFWAAALGGYGVMTSPAVGALCAAQITGADATDGSGVDAAGVGPGRLNRSLGAVKNQ